jgi:hypothetical protein
MASDKPQNGCALKREVFFTPPAWRFPRGCAGANPQGHRIRLRYIMSVFQGGAREQALATLRRIN